MWYLYKLPQPQSRDASILKIKYLAAAPFIIAFYSNNE